jgi:hypothetical protein
MVLFGIFNTRWGISVDTFAINLIYGPLAYLFITLSGIMVIKLFQVLDPDFYRGKLTKKRVSIMLGAFYLIGLVFSIVNVVINRSNYYFNVPIIIFASFIGILWGLISIIGFKFRKSVPIVKICVVVLIFSIGLIYGSFLNTFLIPVYIYFFFFSISFLQLSRELTKHFNKQEENEDFPLRFDDDKRLKFSLFFQILALLFLILPIFNLAMFTALIVFLFISGLTIIGLTLFLILASIIENDIYKKISSMLKIGILLELILLLIIGK